MVMMFRKIQINFMTKNQEHTQKDEQKSIDKTFNY